MIYKEEAAPDIVKRKSSAEIPNYRKCPEEYIHKLEERRVSASHQNQAINAIKFYFEKVKGGEKKYYHVDRPIREKALPEVLSEEEVLLILKSIKNLKH